MAIGSFNPEKNIAYLKYKELNPTNKKKHDAIFEQMKIHYANWQDAVEGANNKNLEQSIRNQLTIQAKSENGKYKDQLNQLTDLLAETQGETVKGQKITNKVKYNSKEITSAATEWLNAETIESKINRGEKVTAEDIESSKVPEGVGGGSLGAAAADDPLVFDANEEGVKAINEVDQKFGGTGKFGRYAIYLIDPISELIEDGAIALATKMGFPRLAAGLTYWMYYEAANAVATVVDAIPQMANITGARQLDQAMILGAGMGLVDEEAFDNWKVELNNITEENLAGIQDDMYQMGERSPLSHAWAAYGKLADETWLPSFPSGLDIYSNALSGIKKITGGR